MKEIYLPALRGLFGERAYYSCVIPAHELVKRVDFANTLHKSKSLSQLIQRELKEKRGKAIAEYLDTEKDRFFNSLVIAVYGGSPQWHQSIMKLGGKVKEASVSEDALNTLGYLKLSGKEKLFAIDGQHRLAGMKVAQQAASASRDDEVSVILISHENNKDGLIKTRRLFTVLNKKAVSVSKGEIIALDENDVMAIVCRELIENSTLFGGQRIAVKPTNNITESDNESITTIGNLYDLLFHVFSKIYHNGKAIDLKNSARPNDLVIEEYYQFALDFFKDMFRIFPELSEFAKKGGEKAAINKYRGKHGGSVLYRPIGLMLIVELIAGLTSTGTPQRKAMSQLAKLKLDLNNEPFADTFWNTKLKRIETKNRVAVRDYLLCDLMVIKSPIKIKAAREKYNRIIDLPT